MVITRIQKKKDGSGIFRVRPQMAHEYLSLSPVNYSDFGHR